MKRATIPFLLFTILMVLDTKLHAQEIPEYRTTILVFDSLTKEPINLADVEVFALLPTGERLREYHGAAEEIDYTDKYPIGTELSISIRKRGYYRKLMNHQVHADPAHNERDAYLFPSNQNTVNIIIEGDLTWDNLGMTTPAKGESIMVMGKNGVRKAPVSEGGHFILELERSDYYGRDSLQMKVGYLSGEYYPIEGWIKTQEKYQFLKLELKPKMVDVLLELEIVDSLDRTPISDALIKIYYGKLLIADGHTDPNGHFGQSKKLDVNMEQFQIEVTREGYQYRDSLRLQAGKSTKIALLSDKVQLKGHITNTKNATLTVTLTGEGFPTQTTRCNPDGSFTFNIPRATLSGIESLKLEVQNGERMGKQTIPVAELLRGNVLEDWQSVDARRYNGAWGTRVLCGVGFAGMPFRDDKTHATGIDHFRVGGHVLVGIKPIPRMLFGVGLSGIYYYEAVTPSYRIWRLQAQPLSLLMRYTNGAFRVPWLRLFVGTSLSKRFQALDGGFSVLPSRRLSFDVSASVGRLVPVVGGSRFWVSVGVDVGVRFGRI